MTASLPDLSQIEEAARAVYRQFQATPQYRWGLSSQRLGTDCWIKHENHTPVGAFKIRGGLTYFDALARRGALPAEVVSATRGNHGQSIGWAARAHGVACTIVVPLGNSLEKNTAMRALGVTLIVCRRGQLCRRDAGARRPQGPGGRRHTVRRQCGHRHTGRCAGRGLRGAVPACAGPTWRLSRLGQVCTLRLNSSAAGEALQYRALAYPGMG